MQKEGGCYPSQSQIQLLAAWQSGEEGCRDAGEQVAKPQLGGGGFWQVARWAGGQAALLDVQGWVMSRGPCCPPQVWSEHSPQQLQTANGHRAF